MGATLDEIRNIEPMRQYLFDVYLFSPAIPMDKLTFRVKSTAIPQKTVDVIEIRYKMGKAQWSGRDNSSKTWRVSFWDDVNLSVYKPLRLWFNKQYESLTGLGLPKLGYIGTGTVVQLDTQNQKKSTWKLIGLFIEDLAEVPLSYESNDPVEVGVTFRYDDIILV